MVQFVSEHEQYASPFPGLHETQGYPQVIKRGYPEWESVSEGDVGTAKHLIFVVHGNVTIYKYTKLRMVNTYQS